MPSRVAAWPNMSEERLIDACEAAGITYYANHGSGLYEQVEALGGFAALDAHTVFDAVKVGQSRWLDLPGVSGAYASVPDHADLDVTGDIDIRCKVALDDWTPASGQVLVAKYVTTGNQRSYLFDVLATSGKLRFAKGTGTSAILLESTVAPTVSDGEALWVRVTRDSSSGDTKFYTGGSGDTPSWSQLGTTVSSAAGGPFSGTAPVEMGSSGEGTSGNLNGRIFAAQVYDGIDGTLVLDADFTSQTPGVSSFTDGTGTHTVTVNGTAKVAPSNSDTIRGWDSAASTYRAAVQATAANRPLYIASAVNGQPVLRFDGTDDSMSTVAFTALTQPNTIIAVFKDSDGSAATRNLYSGAGLERHNGGVSGATPSVYGYAGNTLGTSSNAGTTWHVGVWLYNTTTSKIWVDGGSTVGSGDAGSEPLGLIRLATNASASSAFWDGDIHFFAVYDGDLYTDNLPRLNALCRALASRVGTTWTDIT